MPPRKYLRAVQLQTELGGLPKLAIFTNSQKIWHGNKTRPPLTWRDMLMKFFMGWKTLILKDSNVERSAFFSCQGDGWGATHGSVAMRSCRVLFGHFLQKGLSANVQHEAQDAKARL